MPEIWKAVVGFEGAYEVSNLGRVRSLDRYVHLTTKTQGRVKRFYRGRILVQGDHPSGHKMVALGAYSGSRKVHALVLAAFVGPRPHGFEVRHLNGVPSDNRLANVEYATRGVNGRDKKWHDGQSTYKLSPSDVREIKLALRGAKRGIQTKLAERYGVLPAAISDIKIGKTHVDVHI